MSETRKPTLPEKLLNVQMKIEAVKKSSFNPHFKSNFADLNEVLAVAKPALNAERLVLVQGPGLSEHGKFIETTIIDVDSGQSVNCRVPYSGTEDNMQKVGAGTTYGRRFGILSLLALESEDDDGETTAGRGTTVAKSAGSKGSGTETGPMSKPHPAKAATPVQTEVPKSTVRKTILEKISLTSKVIIDSKRDTQDNVVKLLTAFGVKTKDELSDDQAKKLLEQLEAKLK